MTTERALAIVGVVGFLIGIGLLVSDHPGLGYTSLIVGCFLMGWSAGQWPWAK